MSGTNNLFKIQNILRENQILISFSGKFTQGLIEELGEAVRLYLEAEDRPKKEIFNIFSIFIEQTQNIKNYCFSKENTSVYDKIANSGIVTIGKSDKGSFICSGNLIETQDAAILENRLNEILGLDKDGLKKKYKEMLKQDVVEGNLGAGLGLIDIARKASNLLEFSISKIDEQYLFFTLKAEV